MVIPPISVTNLVVKSKRIRFYVLVLYPFVVDCSMHLCILSCMDCCALSWFNEDCYLTNNRDGPSHIRVSWEFRSQHVPVSIEEHVPISIEEPVS